MTARYRLSQVFTTCRPSLRGVGRQHSYCYNFACNNIVKRLKVMHFNTAVIGGYAFSHRRSALPHPL